MLSKALRPKIICLDPGHSEADPGVIGPVRKIAEHEVVLDVALRLRQILHSNGLRVVMTRASADPLAPTVPEDLQSRCNFVNSHVPSIDLLISLHCNASALWEVRGVETFWDKPHSRQYAFQVQSELWKVFHSTHNKHRSMKASQKHLYMLHCINCPGISIDLGVLTNKWDERLLASPMNRMTAAVAIAKGILGDTHLHPLIENIYG